MIMGAMNKFDPLKWRVERERFRISSPKPSPAEPDLSLRPAIRRLFKIIDSQAGSPFQKLSAKWTLIAGGQIAGHSRPGALTGNILDISVDSSSWLVEIKRFHSGDILRKINEEIGPGTVKELRFKVDPARVAQS